MTRQGFKILRLWDESFFCERFVILHNDNQAVPIAV